MRILLAILIFLPFFSIAQRIKVTASPGEYTTLLQRNDSAFDATSGKPVFIAKNVLKIFGGAHHFFVEYKDSTIAGAGDGSAGELGNGSTTGAATPQLALVDNLGNPLPKIVDMCLSANLNSPYWQTAAIGVDGSLYVCGVTLGGVLGNGTAGSAATTRFTKVPFPAGVKIKKVQAGRFMMALDTDGNVWTWAGNGDKYCLGQGNSPIYLTPTKINIGGQIATDIAGGSNWNYVNTSINHIWSWCYQFLTDYNGTYPTGTNPTVPEDITAVLALPAPIAKMAVNNESTYVILTNGTFWAWGGNVNGSVGNGDGVDMSRYGGYPLPYGTTNPFYYAWDQGFHEYQVLKPVQIAKGKNDFTDIYTTNALCYNIYVGDSKNRLFAWGRNKQSICYGLGAANQINGAIQSNYPNSWDVHYPKEVDPFSVVSVAQATSPDCLKPSAQQLHPTACAIYNQPAHTTSIAVFNGSFVNGKIVLDNSQSSDAVFISYRIMTQTAGPATLDMGIQDALNDTISTANGGVIPNGTYSFRLKLVNNAWDSTFATINVVVGSIPPTVSAGFNQTVNSPINSVDLVGSITTNSGSSVSSIAWTEISGPNVATISPTNTPSTTVSNLIIGTYTFQLRVVDTNGLASSSQVQVIVNPPVPYNGIIIHIGRIKRFIRF